MGFTIDIVLDSITGSVLRPEYSADKNGALIRAGSGKDIETMGEDVDPNMSKHEITPVGNNNPNKVTQQESDPDGN